MSKPDSWAPPISIERSIVPPFPVDVMPEPLRSWIIATAEATQTPHDLAGLLSLAICSGAAARRVEVVAGRGWREPINLYGACLLEPANRKSAVFNAATKPLRLIERELVDAAIPEIAKLESDRRIKESAQKAAEKVAATKGCPEARETARTLAEELANEPIPALPKLLVDDATAEAIENALALQGGRLIVCGCEGGLFDVMAGRYSSGAGNLDAFLKGHAGDDLRVDRVIRGSIMVERCCLTLAYAVQPDVIQGMAAKPSFRGRGLIGRFLYAVPESPLGRRRINPEPVPDRVARSYEMMVRRLAAIRCGVEGPELMKLAGNASKQFLRWQAEVELMLGENGRLELFKDWGGKLCGLTARLASVMHLVGNNQPEPWRDPIGVESIESAITLARWAIPHAEAMLALMAGNDGTADDARYLLRWIREKSHTHFSRRDAQNHGRRRFDGDPERLDSALGLLLDHGWIRPIGGGVPDGPGRPPSPLFEVHPEAMADRASVPVAGAIRSGGRDRGVI